MQATTLSAPLPQHLFQRLEASPRLSFAVANGQRAFLLLLPAVLPLSQPYFIPLVAGAKRSLLEPRRTSRHNNFTRHRFGHRLYFYNVINRLFCEVFHRDNAHRRQIIG